MSAPEAPEVPPPLSLTVRPGSPADGDRGILRVSRATLARLGLRPGDTVEVGRAPGLLARALVSRTIGRDDITLSPDQLTACAAAEGEPIDLRPVELPPARSVAVGGTGLRGRDRDWIRAALIDRPVGIGNTLAMPRGMPGTASVTAVEPHPRAIVCSTSEIAIACAEEDAAYAGIGGLGPQIARVREMIDLPRRRPELFAAFGVTPPRGVLFTGPPGCGKTLVARTVAETMGASFIAIDGPEILTKHYGETEARLRDLFARAAKEAPSVVFIDEIDAIAPKRAALSGEKQLERRLVAQLLSLLDGLSDRGDITVMGATNLPHALDPALRRPGRFDREIAFLPPDTADRREILDIHLAALPLAPEIDLDELAETTVGFVGADLAALAREAATAAVARLAVPAPDCKTSAPLRVEATDISRAFAMVGPSLLRDNRSVAGTATWADLGGLDEMRRTLEEALLWPRRHREAQVALAVRPAAGVLLVGPPGTGKSLIARAVASEFGFNFLPVRAPQLLSQFLGEPERLVAELFERARHAAPSVLFFDEIDALATVRGRADAALDRLVGHMLAEIDGVGGRSEIVILAATNRPEAVDPALLRPGRIDLVIEVPLPEMEARRDILAVHCRTRPLSPEVDLDDLAQRTCGWSGAGLAGLCDAAARHALARWVGNAEHRDRPQIAACDFDHALAALSAGRPGKPDVT